jgi:HAMP domain-containing protein
MGLRIKIISGFIILALMLSIAGVWTILELNSAGTSVSNILEENYKSIKAAKLMRESIERQDSGMLMLLLDHSPKAKDILAEADKVFLEAFKTAENNITIEGEKEFLNKIQTAYNNFTKLWKEAVANEKTIKPKEWYLTKSHPLLIEIINFIENIEDLNNSAMYKTSLSIRSKSERAIVPGIIAVLASIIFTIVFNYFINIFVINPINKTTEAIDNFIGKRIPYEYNLDSKDEIAELTRAVYLLSSYVQFNERTQ